jgi:hypothetical protein
LAVDYGLSVNPDALREAFQAWLDIPEVVILDQDYSESTFLEQI